MAREEEAKERLTTRAFKQTTKIAAKKTAIQKKKIEKAEKTEKTEKNRKMTAAKKRKILSKNVLQPQLEAFYIY